VAGVGDRARPLDLPRRTQAGLSVVATLIRSYEAALDAQLELIERRAFGQAEARDEQVVEPGFT